MNDEIYNKHNSVTFPLQNQIKYSQDFKFLEKIPSVPLKILEKVTDSKISMVGHGYGANGSYGNGEIYISMSRIIEELERLYAIEKKYKDLQDKKELKLIGNRRASYAKTSSADTNKINVTTNDTFGSIY